MLPWVCSVIDHRRRQNVVRTSVTHSAIASCATFLFLPHFDVSLTDPLQSPSRETQRSRTLDLQKLISTLSIELSQRNKE